MSADSLTTIMFFLPIGIAIVFRRRCWIALPLSVITTLLLWFAVMRAVDREVIAAQQAITADQLYDGTGDRVVALFIGWVPGAISTAVSTCLIALVPYLRNRRALASGFSVVPLEKPHDAPDASHRPSGYDSE
jgi:hypothetical protein